MNTQANDKILIKITLINQQSFSNSLFSHFGKSRYPCTLFVRSIYGKQVLLYARVSKKTVL